MKRLVFIGSGNVAQGLAPAIDALEGYTVSQVLSRNIDHAKALADRLSAAQAISSYAEIDPDADFILIAANDDAIDSIAQSIPQSFKGITMHTSGSIPLDVLKSRREDSAVFYPFQTFTAGRAVNLSAVPFFIEAASDRAKTEAMALARKLSPTVYEADSDARRVLHIAGVFTNNFTNHLLHITETLLAEKNIPFSVMQPLAEETVRKAFTLSPKAAQTGPARRGDTDVIAKHLEMLSGTNAQIYKLLTESIIRKLED